MGDPASDVQCISETTFAEAAQERALSGWTTEYRQCSTTFHQPFPQLWLFLSCGFATQPSGYALPGHISCCRPVWACQPSVLVHPPHLSHAIPATSFFAILYSSLLDRSQGAPLLLVLTFRVASLYSCHVTLRHLHQQGPGDRGCQAGQPSPSQWTSPLWHF